jgi:hypothetical protein
LFAEKNLKKKSGKNRLPHAAKQKKPFKNNQKRLLDGNNV